MGFFTISWQFCQAHFFPVIWRFQRNFSNTPSSYLCRIWANISPFPQQAFQYRAQQEGLLQWMWLLCALVPTELICYPSSFQTGALQLSSWGCLVTSCPTALSGFFLLFRPWCGSAPEAWIILHDKATRARGGVPCTPNTTTHCSYLALAFLRPWGLLLPCPRAGMSCPTALQLSGSPEALSW